MTAGYSGTPLSKKLGIREGHTVAVVNDPGHLAELLTPLPADVTIRYTARGRAEIVVLFTKRRAELAKRLVPLAQKVFPDGMVWVCWPKKAAKVPTDMSEDVVRELALPEGLVDVKVCAVDNTWSGLKIVWRKELR